MKDIAFAGESIVSENEGELSVNKVNSHGNVTNGGEEVYIGVDKDIVMGSLMTLKKSLDSQREKVIYMLAVVGAESTGGSGGGGGKEEQLVQVIEKLRLELENEKRKRTSLEMELEFLKMHITNSTSDV